MSEVATKNHSKLTRSMRKPEVPASRLPGKAQSDVSSAYWLAASLRRRQCRHVGDEHDGGEGIGETVDADAGREQPEFAAAMIAMDSEIGEAQMRGRGKHGSDQQARHHADPRHDIARQKRAAERHPEAEEFGHRGDVAVGIMQALEQRGRPSRSICSPACGNRPPGEGSGWRAARGG